MQINKINSLAFHGSLVLPVYKRNNIEKLTGSGVDGVAVVSAIFAAKDIRKQCEKLKVLSERMIEG